MTEKDFIEWLKGYTEGVHHYSISPSQWQVLKDKLSTVGKTTSYTVDSDYWTTNIA